MNRKKFAAAILTLSFAVSALHMPAYAAAGTKSFKAMYADAASELLVKNAKKNTNLLISPVSILTAVNMMENGAAGKTRTQIENTFGKVKTSAMTSGLSSLIRRLSQTEYYTFRSHSAVWANSRQISVKSGYTNRLKQAYGASVYESNFGKATVAEINDWVSKQTNKKITQIIDRLSPQDRILLVNATYFKGQWVEPYSRSVKRKFTDASGQTKKTATLVGTEHEYFEVNGAKAYVKHYAGGKIAFVGILPPKGTSPKSFMTKTSGSAILKAYKKRKTSNIIVHTSVPKFSYSSEMSLKKSLKGMGIKNAFAISADFSKMADKPVFVDDVLHETFISLDEKGTEAAAVTGVIMKASAAFDPQKPEEKTVYLNRPFVYEIVEADTGLPLFVGIINKL